MLVFFLVKLASSVRGILVKLASSVRGILVK